MRVLIDARLPDERSGGVQQWVLGLASGLSKLEGTEEYLFLMKEGEDGWLAPYLHGPCRVYVDRPPEPAPAATRSRPKTTSPARRIRRALGRLLPILGRLRRRLASRAAAPAGPAGPPPTPFDRIAARALADVVHFPRQTAALTSVPSIYQPWDLQHLHLPEFFTPEQLHDRGELYAAFSAQAALVVVATRWVAADVSDKLSVPMRRIAVVNPGPPTAVYAPPTADDERLASEELRLPDRFVFYPAQPWGHKNHERLFEAIRLLRDGGVAVPLVCSGYHNDGYQRVFDQAKERGLESAIRFLGFVSATQLQVLYRRATALIFPSLYEGWGLPILEAFSAGVPVACSNVTSLPELVGDAALVFDPLDPSAIAAAIERLWTDGELRRSLIARGRVRGAQFDWDHTARLMRAHYRRVGGYRLSREDRELIEAEPLV